MKLYEVKKTRREIWNQGKEQDGSYDVSGRKLTSLQGAPEIVYGNFDCRCNFLASLVGGPRIVYGNYNCGGNAILTMDGFPERVGGQFNIAYNSFKTFKGIYKKTKFIGEALICYTAGSPSGLLDVCLIRGLQYVETGSDVINNVFRDVFQRTQDPCERLILAQDELIERGYSNLAEYK